MLQNIAMYFTNIWNATVAFFVNADPMVWLAIVAAIVGAMVALCIDNLERQKEMLDSEEIGELAQVMWEEYQRETTLELIVGKDCPFCPQGDNGYHQNKIKAGCFVDGQPACEWCDMTDSLVKAHMAGEVSPMSPEQVSRLVSSEVSDETS